MAVTVKDFIDSGFKPYRKVFSGGKWHYIKCSRNNYFSSVVSRYCDLRLIKGDVEIVFGLYSPNRAPVIVYPLYGNNSHDIERVMNSKTVNEIIEDASRVNKQVQAIIH